MCVGYILYKIIVVCSFDSLACLKQGHVQGCTDSALVYRVTTKITTNKVVCALLAMLLGLDDLVVLVVNL